MKDPPGNGTIHILTASMSIPWLYYSFVGWYHWGKLAKGPMRSLCIISYDYKIKCLLKKKNENIIKCDLVSKNKLIKDQNKNKLDYGTIERAV